MANTYTLIASNTLTGSQTSVTFSSIPSTYTDLLLRYSARSTGASLVLRFYTNSGTPASTFSYTSLIGNGAAASSSRNSAQSYWLDTNGLPASTYTANTFNNGDLYIPNYAVSATKVASNFSVTETNATTAYIELDANLKGTTETVTQLYIETANGFAVGSSFYLYGIKNS